MDCAGWLERGACGDCEDPGADHAGKPEDRRTTAVEAAKTFWKRIMAKTSAIWIFRLMRNTKMIFIKNLENFSINEVPVQ